MNSLTRFLIIFATAPGSLLMAATAHAEVVWCSAKPKSVFEASKSAYLDPPQEVDGEQGRAALSSGFDEYVAKTYYDGDNSHFNTKCEAIADLPLPFNAHYDDGKYNNYREENTRIWHAGWNPIEVVYLAKKLAISKNQNGSDDNGREYYYCMNTFAPGYDTVSYSAVFSGEPIHSTEYAVKFGAYLQSLDGKAYSPNCFGGSHDRADAEEAKNNAMGRDRAMLRSQPELFKIVDTGWRLNGGASSSSSHPTTHRAVPHKAPVRRH